jgi:hypothetical protein
MLAWSSANFWAVTALVLELLEPLPGAVVPVVPDAAPVDEDPFFDPDPVDPAPDDPVLVDDGPPDPDEDAADSSAAVSAASSAATVLMSVANVACAEDAAPSDWVQVAAVEVAGMIGDREGCVLPAVCVDEDVDDTTGAGAVHAEVAAARAVPTAVESTSSCFWSATRVAWSWLTGVPLELVAPPTDGVPAVKTLVSVAAGVVVPAWLASSVAKEAWAEATAASSVTTAFCSGVGSNEASTWPAVTCWPTATSTALTVPATLKLRLAWFTGLIVPTELSVATTVPEPTVAVR